MKLGLVIPGIFRSFGTDVSQHFIHKISPKALFRALSRAKKITDNQKASRLSLPWLGFSDKRFPWARLHAESLGLTNDLGTQHWAYLSPISFLIERTTLRLSGQAHWDFSEQDEENLVNTIRELLQEDGIKIFIAAPGLWLLHSETPIAVHNQHYYELILKDMLDKQAHVNSTQWQGLLSELQMLLFQHSVCQQRRANGQADINGLWLWGAGEQIPEQTATVKAWDAILCDNTSIQQYARHIGLPYYSLQDFPRIKDDSSIQNLLMADYSLLQPLAHADFPQWEKQLLQLMEAVIDDGLSLRGSITQVNVWTSEKHYYQILPYQKYYFFKRTQSASQFLSD
ncbi:MAG: hypothetical protein AAGB12_10710 [Pseudomonadota bacterium]